MAVKDWSTTAGSNTGILTGITLDGASMNVPLTDDAFREMAAQLAAQIGKVGYKGADIASAATTDLSTATGWYVDVTGTTSITSLGSVAAGQVFILRFASTLTLTHNATTLILPGSTSVTTKGGDVAIMVSLGAGAWRCLSYQPISGFGDVVRIQTFSASGTYTPHANMVSCVIEAVGAGGGGGGAQGVTDTRTGGAGGGAGGYSRTVATRATIGASQVVTCNAGGAGGSSGNGGTGNTTSVGSLCIAIGGNGGGTSIGTGTMGAGGPGGAAGTGTVAFAGNPGGSGFVSKTDTLAYAYSGSGGASFFGGAGAGEYQAAGNLGRTGSGGSGGHSITSGNAAGGAGGAGYVVITEYCSG